MPTTETTYCVWYASAGCLPDADCPEFLGTLEECEAYVAEQEEQRESDLDRAEHDLYDWSIDLVYVDNDDETV